MKHALLSVSDKRGIAALGRGLRDAGYRLISTGGTARALRDAGLEVIPIDEVTGHPECLGGRVKTLHPRIHGGILFRRADPEHAGQAADLGMPDIDVVAVNLYPFEDKAIGGGLPLDEAVEVIDIGGPTMVRAAAKNWADVTVLVDPSDYEGVVTELTSEGATSKATRRRLAAAAFTHTARYDALVARRFQAEVDGTDTLGAHLVLPLDRVAALRYGENPHQAAAVYRVAGTPPGAVGAEQLWGKALSYNNLLDLDAAWALVRSLPAGAAAVIKHTNPCGAAFVDGDPLASYRRALETDPISAFGGIAAIHGRVNAALAGQMSEIFLEIVAAVDFDPEAREILQRKKNLRLMRMPPAADDGGLFPWTFRHLGGGALVQQGDEEPDDLDAATVATQRAPTDAEWQGLRLMWAVCRHVKSNAIVCGDALGTTAVGAGQMSRVDAVRLCQLKAKLPLDGSVAASDAFFPFPDGVEALAEAGITAIVQPGGSIRDEQVVAAADRLGLAMVHTGRRHFRH